uniref:Uncharacterized protein n=1 Tax=Anguilla anguilla TaxID=7936 RepID=A0A0E9U1H7_ANGAN
MANKRRHVIGREGLHYPGTLDKKKQRASCISDTDPYWSYASQLGKELSRRTRSDIASCVEVDTACLYFSLS